MKIARRIIMYILLIGLCISAFTRILADEKVSMVENVMPNEDKGGASDEFSKVSGKVSLIRDSIVRIDDADEAQYDFLITEYTVLVDTKGFISADSIKEGDDITVYYIMPDFMIMIYPPQYEASVILKKPEKSIDNVFVGFFDSNHLSSDNELKLNVTDETPIFTRTGEVYKGSIENKTLMVFYSFVSMSLPPQTSPVKIVVLDTAPKKKLDLAKLAETPIYVNGAHIAGASAYLNRDGIIMVPLRHISDALGFDLHWDGDLRQVRVGTATIMTIGGNEYTVGMAMPRELDAAPEIRDDYAYVPVSFLTDIMGIGYDTDGGILAFGVLND